MVTESQEHDCTPPTDHGSEPLPDLDPEDAPTLGNPIEEHNTIECDQGETQNSGGG